MPGEANVLGLPLASNSYTQHPNPKWGVVSEVTSKSWGSIFKLAV